MNHIDNLKGVIFDYGGTIDSRGVHWSEVIWDGYCDAHVAVTKEQFRECYVFAERELAKVRHILPHHNFHDLLLIKMRIELGYLAEQGLLNADSIEPLAAQIALYCYRAARSSVEEARPVLEALYARYPMVLVSNFYGNVESVLADFDLRRYFRDIIESAVVGVRKPDPAIYRLGVEATGFEAKDVLVVGDSFGKDIVPARAVGCQTVWLKGEGWTEQEEDESLPDAVITDLAQLLSVVK